MRGIGPFVVNGMTEFCEVKRRALNTSWFNNFLKYTTLSLGRCVQPCEEVQRMFLVFYIFFCYLSSCREIQQLVLAKQRAAQEAEHLAAQLSTSEKDLDNLQKSCDLLQDKLSAGENRLGQLEGN